MSRPVCHVVAGPNGSGKSTFALDYLPEFAGSIEYVNFRVFDASEIKQRLIYTRNGKVATAPSPSHLFEFNRHLSTYDGEGAVATLADSVHSLTPKMSKADRQVQEASDAATWDAIEAYRTTGDMVPAMRDGKLVFLTVDEALRSRDDYDRRRRESGEWKLKNLMDQFEAEGLELTSDVWDRLAADRRQALEDELAWIEKGRMLCERKH